MMVVYERAKGIRKMDVVAKPVAHPARSHVLIIEDEEGVANIIAHTLTSYGISYEVFSGGQSAMSSGDPHRADVMFLDVTLENSDGIEVIRTLAEQKYGGAVQLVSGQSPEVLEEIKEIGVRHGLRMRQPITKPFGPSAIRPVVEHECLGKTKDLAGSVTLREALDHKWLEFWYQPKISLDKRRLIGAEALARIRHPDAGILEPSLFLSGASELDLIPLAGLAIRTALRDWSIFKESGLNLHLSVNVTPSSLIKLPIASLVRQARPSDPKWPGLILEITENEVIQDVTLLRELGTQLGLYGVSFSVDDFGAGYSSMLRLHDLRVAELKLDRELVRGCSDNSRKRAICQAAIDLGHHLSAKVVAEGVETLDDLDTLAKMGCDLGQGFLFSRPVERDVLITMAHSRMDAEERYVVSLAAE
jgi:EAL domain-containing protein (putative c-di-GMP-specific phosphodiesterase class I)